MFLKETGRRDRRHSGHTSWPWSTAQGPYLAEGPVASPCQAAAGKHSPAETMPVDPPAETAVSGSRSHSALLHKWLTPALGSVGLRTA